ncbi:MAG: ATP-grasp domain-containing protein [Thermoanaerobaculia bacterium]|nr:ATP-grasp domain-containing protein [Thermoanaerobaculia bacterium]
MTVVVYAIPVLTDNALRYLRGVARLPEVRLGVVSHKPLLAFPRDLQTRVLAHRTVANALDPDILTEAVQQISRRLGRVDRLLGMLEQIQGPLAEVRRRLDIPGMSPEVARNFRDKDRMKAVLREAGLPVARSRRITQPSDLEKLTDEVGFPIVVKPLQGAGARATFRVENGDQLLQTMSQIPAAPENPWQAEEFVRGEENTFETIFTQGKPRWWSGTRYLPGPLTVLENPWIQYTVLLPAEPETDFLEFRDINFAALKALGLKTGLSHMEWFRRDDGSMVISEVGARPPGVHIMPLNTYAHQRDIIQAWGALMVRGEFDPPRRVAAAGAAFFRGQGRGARVVGVHGLDEAQREVGALVVERQLPSLGQPKASGYEGEGWAIVTHPETRTVAHALSRLVELVRVELG